MKEAGRYLGFVRRGTLSNEDGEMSISVEISTDQTVSDLNMYCFFSRKYIQ